VQPFLFWDEKYQNRAELAWFRSLGLNRVRLHFGRSNSRLFAQAHGAKARRFEQ